MGYISQPQLTACCECSSQSYSPVNRILNTIAKQDGAGGKKALFHIRSFNWICGFKEAEIWSWSWTCYWSSVIRKGPSRGTEDVKGGGFSQPRLHTKPRGALLEEAIRGRGMLSPPFPTMGVHVYVIEVW